VADASVNICAG